MGQTLILKDGRRELVSRDRHFTDLLRKYMGDDAAQYYEDRVGDLLRTIDKAKSYSNVREIREALEDVEYE